jgi:hypothetical protein
MQDGPALSSPAVAAATAVTAAVVTTTAAATAAAAAIATTAATTAGAATTAVAAAATAAATTAAATATATAATTAFPGGCFVDADHATHPLHILEVIDGFLLIGVVAHLDKSEAALTAGFPVEGQAALLDLAVLAEEVEQILLFGLEREVAYVNGHSFSGTWN